MAMGPRFLLVDPRTLRLPPTRLQGADPSKLQRQIARYGRSVTGMPRLEVIRDPQGELMITDGVTRATRIAKLSPGTVVSVENWRKQEVAEITSTRLGAIAMIAASRQELLKALERLSEEYPNMRFGQLIANLTTLGRGVDVGDIWEAEDEELLNGARQFLQSAEARKSEVA